MNDQMKKMAKCLKDSNCLVKSEIEELSDLLWSMAACCIYPGGDKLIEWFNSPVPAFDNRSPLDILHKYGEEELFKHLNTLHM